MSSLEHTFAAEQIMAFVDGELPAVEMRAVESHLQECAECAGLAESFRVTSAWMARWDVETVPESMERPLTSGVDPRDAAHRPRRSGLRTWQLWTGGAMATTALAVCVSVVSFRPANRLDVFMSPLEQRRSAAAAVRGLAPPPPLPAQSTVMADALAPDAVSFGYGSVQTSNRLAEKAVLGGALTVPASTAPMIARTASVVVVVKNLNASRVSLEQILARENGYVAHLTAGNAEDGPPTFQASLRIPAAELPSALRALKALGRTVTESQGGEEVTQEHADLVARLQNARETEDRYRAILAQHTGKVADILEVEEHISEVRGEIEQMEAEQKALDHRVDFATVDVQLTEEYKARLNAPDASVYTQVHNAFVAGYRHVADTLLGLVLFGEEYAPAIVLWLAILCVPGILLWRRYRRIRARLP